MKRVWLFRLGKFGETEAHALATGELVSGWGIEDIAATTGREQILAALERTYPEEKAGTLNNWAVQINQLKNAIQPGDLTVTTLKTTGQIAIGQVEGGFIQINGGPARKVRWLKTDVERAAVLQDLLYSLGASQTVCEVSRNEALRRFEVIAQTGRDPGTGAGKVDTSASAPDIVFDADLAQIDLSEVARDQIERKIASNFAGHGFTRLIAAILHAQGYRVHVSPPGADQGIDIVAGQGALGFGGPRLVVQVKSGDIVADQPTLQALIGCVQDTHAEHGLLVSWGGFKGTVHRRANDLYFRIRLWGRAEVLDALFETYDLLPEDIKADLPLRRVWTVVPG